MSVAFSYQCKGCGLIFGMELAEGEDPRVPCPTCGVECHWIRRGEVRVPIALEGAEYESTSLGVHPHQIAEAQAKFPHHRFAPNGNMLIHGQKEKNRVLRDIGYVEYDKNDLKHRG